MTTSKVGYVLALLLLPLLAACGNQVPVPTQTIAHSATAEPSSTPVPTVEPTATLTPTEIPDPEVTFEQLSQIDSRLGSFAEDEEGNLIYNSPLYNTEVGKNIPIVQQYREVGLDGGSEVWVAPEKYPNAPMFVQDLDNGEIRQGPFKYDNDVRRRLTLPTSGTIFNEYIAKGLEGWEAPLSMVKVLTNPYGHDEFAVTMFPTTSGLVEKDDHLVLPVRSYIGDENDMLAYYYDLSLGPIGEDNSYYNPRYRFYDNGYESAGGLNDMVNPIYTDYFGRMFNLTSRQIMVTGFHDMASRESIPQNTYSGNFYYAEDNVAESSALLSILKSGGIEEIKDGLDYTSLSLYGGINIVLR